MKKFVGGKKGQEKTLKELEDDFEKRDKGGKSETSSVSTVKALSTSSGSIAKSKRDEFKESKDPREGASDKPQGGSTDIPWKTVQSEEKPRRYMTNLLLQISLFHRLNDHYSLDQMVAMID